ncbi:MAG: Mth938-like domain-containing protein [Gemmatimonadota bacterium]
MKLHADALTSLNTVTAYGPGFVEVNQVRHSGNLILTPDQPVESWSAESFDALRVEDFELILALRPEIVLVGTGSRQRFPHPRLTRPLLDAHVGVEAMDTRAACRTYNILMGEGRRVVAVFLQET